MNLFQLENIQLKQQIACYRMRYSMSDFHSLRVDEALKNAGALLALYASGSPWSRRAAMQHGMTHRQWENAIVLLSAARLLTSARRFAITPIDALHIGDKLSVAADALKRDRDRWDLYSRVALRYQKRLVNKKR